jgi:hypothetical protein
MRNRDPSTRRARGLYTLLAAALVCALCAGPASAKTLKEAQAEAKAKKDAAAAASGASDAIATADPAPGDPAPPKRTLILPGSGAPATVADANPQPAAAPPPAAAAAPSAPPTPAALAAIAAANLKEVETLISDAAVAEKAAQCEVAYGRYQAALDKVGGVADKARSAELESIAQNKLDKLDDCYRSCQPSGRQRSLFESATGAKDRGETKRAVQITRKLLTGKNQKCIFWGQVRDFLATLPNQAEELASDKVDPCEVTPEVQAELEQARAAAKQEQAQLADLLADKNKLAKNLDALVELYRSLDRTRQKVFEMREEFLDCDAVYKPLVEDAARLHDIYDQSQGAILATYRTQLDGLARRVRAANAQIAERNKLLESKSAEQERLAKNLDDLGKFNEELYDDLFSLAGSEAINFTTQVEGRRIEKPMEEIRALIADEGKVISTLEAKYPEYFKDGTNIEALKRKKLVLEKIGQMLTRFGKAKGETHPGYQRALDEVDATVKMLDKAIVAKESAAPKGGEEKKDDGVPVWLIALGVVAVVGGLVFWRIKAGGEPPQRGLRG